jgi:hypothetical protein
VTLGDGERLQQKRTPTPRPGPSHLRRDWDCLTYVLMEVGCQKQSRLPLCHASRTTPPSGHNYYRYQLGFFPCTPSCADSVWPQGVVCALCQLSPVRFERLLESLSERQISSHGKRGATRPLRNALLYRSHAVIYKISTLPLRVLKPLIPSSHQSREGTP